MRKFENESESTKKSDALQSHNFFRKDVSLKKGRSNAEFVQSNILAEKESIDTSLEEMFDEGQENIKEDDMKHRMLLANRDGIK